MDAFRRGALLMTGSARGVSAEYRAQGTGTPIPCRALFFREPDETGRPGLAGSRIIASGHFDPARGLVAVARSDTLTISGKTYRVDQRPTPELGWDWRVYLQDAP